LNPDPVRRQV